MKNLFKGFVSLGLLAGFVLCPNTFAQSSVGDVTVKFCNDGKLTNSLSMIMDSGVEGEICLEFGNASAQDVAIKYGFVDGTVTADANKYKACQQEGTIDNFGQYVTSEYDTITIPSQEVVRQKAKIKFPGGFSGMVNGCLTYYIAEADTTADPNDGSMFKILVRKAQFIDVLVGGEMKRSIKLPDQSAVTSTYDKSSKQLLVSVSLLNDGNVDEIISITGTVSNSFGYSATFESTGSKLVSDDSSVINVEIPDLPRYKMGYNVDMTITSNPSFVFNADALPDDIKQPIVIKTSTSIFVFPRIVVCGLGGLLILILLIVFIAKHVRLK